MQVKKSGKDVRIVGQVGRAQVILQLTEDLGGTVRCVGEGHNEVLPVWVAAAIARRLVRLE